jgi:hypothetical protein
VGSGSVLAIGKVEWLGLAMNGQGGMLLAGLALSTAIHPDRWVHVGGSTGSYEEYLDRESVNRNGDKVTVWTRRDFVLNQGTAWHEVELDCSTRTETILSYVRDDGGTISHNVVRPHRDSAPIAPQSVAERIFNIACR